VRFDSIRFATIRVASRARAAVPAPRRVAPSVAFAVVASRARARRRARARASSSAASVSTFETFVIAARHCLPIRRDTPRRAARARRRDAARDERERRQLPAHVLAPGAAPRAVRQPRAVATKVD
jgi:hypothetical protein